MGEYGSMFLLFPLTAFATFFCFITSSLFVFFADTCTLRVKVIKVLFWVS